jgi:hypothetical protein
MHPSEYFQHLYMILGRARSLDWCLFRNFPETAEGEPDWSLFETGPPDFLVHFFKVLEEKAAATVPRIEEARKALKLFPPWAERPLLHPDCNEPGRYVYNKDDWDATLTAGLESMAPLSAAVAAGPDSMAPPCAARKRPLEQPEIAGRKRRRSEAGPAASSLPKCAEAGPTASSLRKRARPFGAEQR